MIPEEVRLGLNCVAPVKRPGDPSRCYEPDEDEPRVRWSKLLNDPLDLPAGTLLSDKAIRVLRNPDDGQALLFGAA